MEGLQSLCLWQHAVNGCKTLHSNGLFLSWSWPGFKSMQEEKSVRHSQLYRASPFVHLQHTMLAQVRPFSPHVWQTRHPWYHVPIQPTIHNRYLVGAKSILQRPQNRYMSLFIIPYFVFRLLCSYLFLSNYVFIFYYNSCTCEISIPLTFDTMRQLVGGISMPKVECNVTVRFRDFDE